MAANDGRPFERGAGRRDPVTAQSVSARPALRTLRRVAGRLDDGRTAWSVLGAALALYVALVLWFGRGTTLFVDEYTMFVDDQGLHPRVLLEPFNGHLVLLQRLVYALNFKAFGADFLVPRIVMAAGGALVVALAFEFARRRVGSALALAPALLLLFFGSGWEQSFVLSGIGNVWAASFGLAAFLALDRPSPRRDVVACVALVGAMCSHTAGAAYLLGAAVLVLLQPGARRRAWIWAVPLALYVAWLVWVRVDYAPSHPDAQTLELLNLLRLPAFVADVAASTFGAIAGLNQPFENPDPERGVYLTHSQWGPLLAGAAAVAFALHARRRGVGPVAWSLLVALVGFWCLLGLGAGLGRTPATIRYTYPGAVLLLVLAAAVVGRARPSPRVLAVVFGVCALALLGNAARLRDGITTYRFESQELRAQLAGLELAGQRTVPGYAPTSGAAQFAAVLPGPYLTAVERIGSPAYSVAELTRRAESNRQAADKVLAEALGLELRPVAAPPPGRSGCTTGATVSARPPGLLLRSRAPAKVTVRKFASTGGVAVGTLAPGRPAELRIPPDPSGRPWTVTVSAGAGVVACPL